LRAELHAITVGTDAIVPTYAEPVARAATPAIAALLAAEVPHEVLQYHHDPRIQSYGEEAVEELALVEGVEPEQVFKTLVIALPKGLAVAVIPVPSKLSLKAAAAALGVPKATMAERAAAERSTGYVIGGISPFGQRKPLPTVVDASALAWDRVLCSAGKRGWDVALHPQDLIELTNAVTADIRA
jgi:Cys-tRNA(Pro)/Cys-tRNA(Cys) deacylase